MISFIATMIEKQANINIEKGKDKYKAYFVKTDMYEKFRKDVDAILSVDGYEEVIIGA